MAEEEDYSKLPLEERVVHKVWRVRQSAYEQAAKDFALGNEGQYASYAGLIKKFVADSNVAAQAKGLEAALAFVENEPAAKRAAGDIVSGIVAKCLNSMKANIKTLASDVCLMLVEIEASEAVVESLVQGFANRQPKIVAGCAAVLTAIVEAFGPAAINVKALLKALPKVFDNTDKNARDQAKALAIELHRWLGDGIAGSFKDIKPVQMTELQEAWAAHDGSRPQPTRFLRSQKPAASAGASGGADGGDDGSEGGAPAGTVVEIDPFDLADPVDVLAKVPKSFSTDIKAEKWSVRRDALQELLNVVKVPKIVPADFAELVRTLVSIINKDKFVLNAGLAADCIAALASGLRKDFSYGSVVFTPMLEKFKEKKANVVSSLQAALDAVAPTMPFDKMAEESLAAANNKNPSVKEETLKFLARFLASVPAAKLTKPILKSICPGLIEHLADSAAGVRDAATAVLGVIVKVAGERPVVPYLDQLDKIKRDKVMEAASSATVTPSAGGSNSAPAAAAASSKAPAAAAPKSRPASSAAKPKSRPATARPASAKTSTSASAKPRSASAGPKKARASAAAAPLATSLPDPTTPAISSDEAKAKIEGLVSSEIREQWANEAWKERLEGAKALLTYVEGLDKISTQDAVVLYKWLEISTKKWKESNFMILGTTFDILGAVAERASPLLPDRCAVIAVPGAVDKLGDIKVRPHALKCLTAMAENLSLNYVSLLVCEHAKGTKSPKVTAEVLGWMTSSVNEFGMIIAPKPHVDFARQCLAAVQPAVRGATVNFLGVLRIFVGPSLLSLFSDEKPALLAVIEEKFKSVEGESPPQPTRKERAAGGDADDDDDSEADGGSAAAPAPVAVDAMDDLLPRTKLTDDVPSSLIEKLGDKNWKIRNEGLEELTSIVGRSPRITADLGDLAPALIARFSDSNAKLVMATCSIFGSIATAMGPNVKKYCHTFLPPIYGVLADAKDSVRGAATDCMTAIYAQTGIVPFLEADLIAKSLKSAKPNEQQALLEWFNGKLEDKQANLKVLVKPLFTCLQHRNGDVRKAAQELLPAIVQSVGMDKVQKACKDLPAASKNAVQAVLDKIQVEPAAAAARPASASSQASSASTTSSKSAAASKRPGTARSASAAGGKKKAAGKKGSVPELEEAPLVLDANGKASRQRDEKALKVLKWNFVAPRDEFVDQLSDQFRSSASRSLHAMLFSSDFKKHLQALDILCNAVSMDDGEAPYADECVACLDLLLKWVTLRFFDTNPTVQLKAMQFLESLFSMLVSMDYEMQELEASAFIPYLTVKSGDKIEKIRESTHTLYQLIRKMYPASKLFVYMLDGLKCKNARQRQECLLEIGAMLSEQGMSVCQIGAAKSLKIISSQVADRDNSVRSAALDVIVIAYDIVGEDVYKLMGDIPDKSRSLIEERIKRNAKSKGGSEAPAPASAAAAAPPSRGERRRKGAKSTSSDGSDSGSASAPRRKPAPGEFSLDLDLIEGEALKVEVPELAPTDIDEHGAAVAVAGATTTSTSTDEDLVAIAANSGAAPTFTLSRQSSGKLAMAEARVEPASSDSAGAPSSSRASGSWVGGLNIDELVGRIASNNVHTALVALKEAEELTKESTASAVDHIDRIITACCLQLRLVFGVHLADDESAEHGLADVLRLCKHLLSCVIHVFSNRVLAHAVVPNVLQELVVELVTRLLDPHLETLEEGAQISRALNAILLKILENANSNAIFGVFIRVLKDSVATGANLPRFSDLVMKCLWKATKALPGMIENINVDELLLDINRFLVAHPPPSWKTRSDDTPLRTMKTILHTLVKIKDKSVLKHLSLIGTTPSDSSTGAYLMLMLEKAGHSREELEAVVKEAQDQAPEWPVVVMRARPGRSGIRSDPKTMSRTESIREFAAMEAQAAEPALSVEEAEARLEAIFAKVTSKDASREGIRELYDFKQANPDVDVQPHIAKTSAFFQKYIERGLSDVAEERERASRPKSSPSRLPVKTASGASAASSYLDRLQALKAKTALNVPRSPQAVVIKPPPEEDIKLPDVVAEGAENSEAVAATEAPASSAADNLAAIKARLARFKK